LKRRKNWESLTPGEREVNEVFESLPRKMQRALRRELREPRAARISQIIFLLLLALILALCALFRQK